MLHGDLVGRPEGLERDLIRSGFQVVEGASLDDVPSRPTLIVATCIDFEAELPRLEELITDSQTRGVRVVLLITGGTSTDLVRAVEAGADDAILLPLEAPVLIARIEARVINSWPGVQGPGATDLKLFGIIQEVAAELHRDDMLTALTRAVAQALDLRSVSCVLHVEESSGGRLLAATDAPRVRDAEVDLGRWPEARAALESRQTVVVRDVARSQLFAEGTGGDPRPTALPHPNLESTAAIPLLPFGRPIGTLVLRTRRGEGVITPGQVAFAELAVSATARLLEADDRRGAIARRQALASHVDPLTGCGTLDALDGRIREEFQRSRRYDVTFALVLLDIDGMRGINDRLGRDGGNRLLADLGRLLQRELRASDFVARYGGEEFLLLLPETDFEGARQTVHRIRDRMAPAGLSELHLGIRCRLTAGVAIYPHPDVHKPEDLFAMVEAAMLAGKGQDVERIGSAA